MHLLSVSCVLCVLFLFAFTANADIWFGYEYYKTGLPFGSKSKERVYVKVIDESSGVVQDVTHIQLGALKITQKVRKFGAVRVVPEGTPYVGYKWAIEPQVSGGSEGVDFITNLETIKLLRQAEMDEKAEIETRMEMYSWGDRDADGNYPELPIKSLRFGKAGQMVQAWMRTDDK